MQGTDDTPLCCKRVLNITPGPGTVVTCKKDHTWLTARDDPRGPHRWVWAGSLTQLQSEAAEWDLDHTVGDVIGILGERQTMVVLLAANIRLRTALVKILGVERLPACARHIARDAINFDDLPAGI